ncbi:hypothetical protein VHUM_02746 [Vanrija humicola]|uniref:Vacuolar protein sorting-associated protein 27 n=1 Tax=Vanrija humicola TaxID=5417 RepID=A0A7D8YXD5_VANHU|nr:hypothetical protein VHUM_02746 [Vanrija humicola]
MSWLWGSSTNAEYEEAVEKACSPLKLPYPQGEDIALNLEITDMIRSKAVEPKPAMQALKQRVASKNGRVQMYALNLVDTCIKNGGDHFLEEIASKEFVDEVAGLIRSSSTNPEVKTMALGFFQQWAIAFQNKKDLAFLVDVYHELKNSGIKFPPAPASQNAHLFETTTAPKWVDSDVCMRCRTPFTFTNRKHHCRNCGKVFDQQCSSHNMTLPRFGIKEEVRVCDGCWIAAGKNKPAPAVPARTPRSRHHYDADLQRAIELSLAQSQPGGLIGSEPPLALKSGSADDDDEQLRLAIEASLREYNARPSAPIGSEEPEFKPLPTFDLAPRETETILTFSNTLDQMAAYGERDLRRFPHAHILHDQAYALGPKLQRNSEEKTTKAQMLAEMQGKLSEAVTLYGQILDGQQAYAARKAQEAQQQQYAQQYQQAYGYQQPYGQAYPAANGYYVPPGPQAYRPPPQAAPAQAAPSAPSIYPSMPTQAPYQQYQQHWAPPTASRQASYAAPSPVAAQAPSAPPHAALQPHAPQQVAEPQQWAAPEPSLPSAPPPVDMASHPSASPTSTTATLPLAPSAPARSASYTSPVAATAPLATSPLASPSISSPQRAQAGLFAAPPQQHAAPSAPAADPAPVVAPAAAAHNAWAGEPTKAGQFYSASMFPSAPEGGLEVPAAPALEKPREEALLIEL